MVGRRKGKKEKEKTRRKSALKIRPRISAMSAHPFLPWVYRGLVGRVPEDIDFRVKPAIFSVDNGGTGRGRRFLAAIRKPTPLDTSFSPFFRLIGEEIFSKRRKKMEERKCVSRRETTRGGWRGEGEVVDPPEFYGPLPLPDYSFLIDARPPASFYELLLPRFFLLLLSQMDLCFPCRWSNPFPSLYARWINTNNIIHK